MKNISTEILMNFNSFGFLREGFRLLKLTLPDELNQVTFEKDEKNSIEKMNKIANGKYWQDIIRDKNADKISMHEAEDRFVTEYILKLKDIYEHVINIPIKEKSSHLPKYRLIFGSNHSDGIKLMIDEMNRGWGTIIENSKENIFDLFEEPNYYTSIHYNLEEEVLKLAEEEIHLKELLLKLINIFGIAYRYSNYTDELSRLSKVPSSLFDDSQQKIIVERRYKTKTGKEASDWNWDKEIYIKRV
jgi:hypothetical protein